MSISELYLQWEKKDVLPIKLVYLIYQHFLHLEPLEDEDAMFDLPDAVFNGKNVMFLNQPELSLYQILDYFSEDIEYMLIGFYDNNTDTYSVLLFQRNVKIQEFCDRMESKDYDIVFKLKEDCFVQFHDIPFFLA